jgi:3-deoxy-D-manno-octulosonate 8-phosphate phosphatase (KDO 8-P phosphatase)
MKNYKEILKDITTLIFDVDGVLTDGSVLIHPNGEKIRTLNSRDGYALQLAVKKGFNICIITGGNSVPVKEALKTLGITDIYLSSSYKPDVLKDYLFERSIKPHNCLYMGDDIPDYHTMQMVALPVCPYDDAKEIKDISLYISPLNGGKGCARDVIEQVLKSQNKWMDSESFKW